MDQTNQNGGNDGAEQDMGTAYPVTWMSSDLGMHDETKVPMVAMTVAGPEGDMMVLAMTLESSQKAVRDVLVSMAKAGDEWAKNIMDRLQATAD